MEPFQLMQEVKFAQVSCQSFTKRAIQMLTLLVKSNEKKRLKCLHFMSKEWSCQITVC